MHRQARFDIYFGNAEDKGPIDRVQLFFSADDDWDEFEQTILAAVRYCREELEGIEDDSTDQPIGV